MVDVMVIIIVTTVTNTTIKDPGITYGPGITYDSYNR